MHVYHFNHYEPTAFKKLVGRYVSRGEQMDRLLRSDRFVDLYPIVKQAVRAGVESYSIKQLEQYSQLHAQGGAQERARAADGRGDGARCQVARRHHQRDS